MKLRAHHNVIDIAEERWRREQEPAGPMMFVDPPPPPRSHPAAQALLAGILQGWGERENDPALLDAGRRLGEAAQKGQHAASGWRQRAKALWTALGVREARAAVLSPLCRALALPSGLPASALRLGCIRRLDALAGEVGGERLGRDVGQRRLALLGDTIEASAHPLWDAQGDTLLGVLLLASPGSGHVESSPSMAPI
jgi:hypothetical protein